MDDFANEFAAMRGQAGEILSRRSNPLMDVGMAALQSYGNPASSVGANLRAIESARGREILGAMSLMRSEAGLRNRDFANDLAAIRAQNLIDTRARTGDYRDRSLALRERNTDSLIDTREANVANRSRTADIRQMEALARNGHREARAVNDVIRLYGGDDPAKRAALFTAMFDDPEPVTAENAGDIAARHAQRLGIAKQTSTARPYRVPEGEEVVTYQPDQTALGGRREIGRAPRSIAKTGGPTLAQDANNAEIDAARQRILSLNLTPAEIKRRSDPAEPNYDPQMGRLVRMATQRKRAGEDPGFNEAWSRVYGGGTSPAVPAAPAVPPAGPSGEMPQPQTAAERDALPPGTQYVAPDGSIRTRQ